MNLFPYNRSYLILNRVGKRTLKTSVSVAAYKSEPETSDKYQQDHGGNSRSSSRKALYPDHIPTTGFQKCIMTAGSAFLALTDPYRDDMVAVLGETTGHSTLKELLATMQKSPEGSQILKDRPRINGSTVSVQELKELPPSTFGNVYATFMEKHGISADSRQPVHFVDDADCAYVIQRYRETHDLVHALLDMPTNMLGEVAVKWVEALQTRLPMCVGAALMGPIRLKPKQREKFRSVYLPWAIRCGQESELFLNIYFEKRWLQPVDELRRELNIPTLPT